MKNLVYWADVVIFEDQTFVLETCKIDVLYEYQSKFNNKQFLTENELDDFFGDNDAIYDCDKFVDKVRDKYNKPFKCVLLDNLELSDEFVKKIVKSYDLAKCGGYINNIMY